MFARARAQEAYGRLKEQIAEVRAARIACRALLGQR
jgi:hypothetical protein